MLTKLKDNIYILLSSSRNWRATVERAVHRNVSRGWFGVCLDLLGCRHDMGAVDQQLQKTGVQYLGS